MALYNCVLKLVYDLGKLEEADDLESQLNQGWVSFSKNNYFTFTKGL